MGIEATSTTMAVSGTTQSTATSGTSAKTNSNTSFKDEMSKVGNTEEKQENKNVSEKSEKSLKSETTKKENKVSSGKTNEKKSSGNTSQDNLQQSLNVQISFNTQLSFNEANMMLTGDIQQMIENTSSLESLNSKSWFIGFGEGSKTNFSMNESDAEFFLNLTEKGDVSLNNIVAQGQNMLNNGAEASEIAQNVKVSQALLTALNEARQNNQPIRIDFDQNISVILRVGRDGAISAQFIPGDKIAEQYLRQNINELRSSFDEQELPYTELSYSNSSKEQNKRRREQSQQGE